MDTSCLVPLSVEEGNTGWVMRRDDQIPEPRSQSQAYIALPKNLPKISIMLALTYMIHFNSVASSYWSPSSLVSG